eukprot:193124_1
MENGQIFQHPPIQQHIKILSMVNKIDLIYGLKQKIYIGEIFVGDMVTNYVHIHGDEVIQEISDLFGGLNHLHWPINIPLVSEVLNIIKYYLFIEFLAQKYQVNTQYNGPFALQYKYKIFSYLNVICRWNLCSVIDICCVDTTVIENEDDRNAEIVRIIQYIAQHGTYRHEQKQIRLTLDWCTDVSKTDINTVANKYQHQMNCLGTNFKKDPANDIQKRDGSVVYYE